MEFYRETRAVSTQLEHSKNRMDTKDAAREFQVMTQFYMYRCDSKSSLYQHTSFTLNTPRNSKRIVCLK